MKKRLTQTVADAHDGREFIVNRLHKRSIEDVRGIDVDDRSQGNGARPLDIKLGLVHIGR